jgi:hypothetical protein
MHKTLEQLEKLVLDHLGINTGITPNNLPHASSGWQKVQAGNLGAVSSLSLTGLTGYLRYHLELTVRGTGGQMPLTMTLNGDTSSNYHAQAFNITNATVTGVSTAAAANVTLIPSNGGGTNNMILLGLDVQHDAQASFNIGFRWQGSSVCTTAASSVGRQGGGQLNVSVASITAIALTFNAAITGGTYILYGSKEIV